MCGIAGFLTPAGLRSEQAAALAGRMAGMLSHRGPDGSGTWIDAHAGIALGHRRLAIVDLSTAGHQPMTSASGRYTVTYNGEIYNHLELRAMLGECAWRGHSDTETLLACIDRWGIAGALVKLVGMFAFAVWDANTRQLTLARDRMGEKPLYYGWQNGTFLFVSELRALHAHPCFAPEVDRHALELLMRYGYVPAPRSIYTGISKLEPGTSITVQGSVARMSEPQAYWALPEPLAAREGGGRTQEDSLHELRQRLAHAVKLQMVADVPLGAFLSGGIDSSTIVALMQAQSARPVKTFTIGFTAATHDEAAHARAVARHIGTDHTEVIVSPAETMAVVPEIPAIYDEPLGDSSQVPTVLVSRVARRAVTVSLSGDGGDELFAGYPHYANAARLWGQVQSVPHLVRRTAVRASRAISTRAFTLGLAPLLALRGRPPTIPPGERVRDLMEAFEHRSEADFYRLMRSHWPARTHVTASNGAATAGRTSIDRWPAQGSFIEKMASLDALTYLPDDILAKVDRAAMSVGLETRVPLLDHRIVELAASLPLDFKVRGGVGKHILRNLLHDLVPRSLVDRPKMGFTIPVGRWLREPPLREWAEPLLASERLRRDGYLDAATVSRRWREHTHGGYDWQESIWTVLMFNAWLDDQQRLRRIAGASAVGSAAQREFAA